MALPFRRHKVRPVAQVESVSEVQHQLQQLVGQLQKQTAELKQTTEEERDRERR